jgi:two-component system response regulator
VIIDSDHKITNQVDSSFKGNLTLIKKVKLWAKYLDYAVIIINEDPDIQKCYKPGANSYIGKPVNFEGFAYAIKNIGFCWLLLNQTPAPF